MQGDEERRAIITLDKLNTVGRIEVDRDELRAAVRVAKAALGKQVPMKVDKRLGFDCCPCCGEIFGNDADIKAIILWSMPRCKICGQALDWD